MRERIARQGRPLTEATRTHPLVVWVINDGKPGHVNQSLGLAEALARASPTDIRTFPALAPWRAWLAWLSKRAPHGKEPRPDLIVGAGHATHLTLLALRRARGGRAVVLMKPSLPRRAFDLCIIPEHDGVEPDAHTLVTEGALNRIRPPALRTTETATRGLLLIGGVSTHFTWDSDAILLQIQSITARTPAIQWTLTTSRRTPEDFLAQLPKTAPNLTVVPHTATPPDWLPAQLVRCDNVWVTPDSASMVFEALTAGADVGVFDLPVNPKSRVAWAVARLADAGRVTRFTAWCAQETPYPALRRKPNPPLAEADRCAAWILDWLGAKH